MNLEEARQDDTGLIVATCITRTGRQISVPITFPDLVIGAFYFTGQTLERLEKSKTALDSGVVTSSAVTLWFLSIEAYINCVLKIACTVFEDDFNKYKKKPLMGRINHLEQLLSLNKIYANETGTKKRLQEFQQFRNEFFHDRSVGHGMTFRHTLFSSLPYRMNQIDVMQAALIAIEIFSLYRFVYAGVDFMPDIFVSIGDSFCFRKCDTLYDAVLCPTFAETLRKHRLTTNLDTARSERSLSSSANVPKGSVRVYITYNGGLPVPGLNSADTSIAAELWATFTGKILLNDKEQFGIPCYHI